MRDDDDQKGADTPQIICMNEQELKGDRIEKAVSQLTTKLLLFVMHEFV
jgi:hypothetical protein